MLKLHKAAQSFFFFESPAFVVLPLQSQCFRKVLVASPLIFFIQSVIYLTWLVTLVFQEL